MIIVCEQSSLATPVSQFDLIGWLMPAMNPAQRSPELTATIELFRDGGCYATASDVEEYGPEYSLDQQGFEAAFEELAIQGLLEVAEDSATLHTLLCGSYSTDPDDFDSTAMALLNYIEANECSLNNTAITNVALEDVGFDLATMPDLIDYLLQDGWLTMDDNKVTAFTDNCQ